MLQVLLRSVKISVIIDAFAQLAHLAQLLCLILDQTATYAAVDTPHG